MMNASGTTQTVYTHDPNIDEPLALERNESYAYYPKLPSFYLPQ